MSILSRVLLYLFFQILIFNYMALNSNVMAHSTYFWRVLTAFLLMTIGLIYGVNISRNIFFLLCSFMLSMVISGFGNPMVLNFLFLIAFCIFSKNIKINYVIECALISLLVAVAVVFISLILNIFDSGVDLSGDRERLMFGFKNANIFPTLYFTFILIFILHHGRLFSLLSFFVFSLGVYIYIKSDTRALIFGIFSLFFLRLIFISTNKSLIKIIIFSLIVSPVILVWSSKFIFINYDWIDILLSNRPKIWSEYISSLPLYSYMWGGVAPEENITIDNSFLLIQSIVGVPVLIFLILKFYKFLCECLDRGFHTIMVVMLSFWIYCYFESNLIRPEIIFSLVFFHLLFNEDFGKKKIIKLGRSPNKSRGGML